MPLYRRILQRAAPNFLRLVPLFGVLVASLLLAGTPGVTAYGQNLAPSSEPDVRLGRPAEGETFYSGPDSLLYSIPINGWAFSDSYPSTALEIELQVIQGHTLLFTQQTQPHPDGSFLFKAEVNPGNTLASFEIAFQGCADKCHDLSALQLPVGTFLLRVTARDPSGAQASDERQVTVDRATLVEVPVRLVLQASTEDLPAELPAGIQVNGSTRLYLWRNRGALGASDARGLASVPVEALSQAPTHYTFEVQPQVVDGVLYQGLETAAVTLLPGQTVISEITLPVQAQVGQISGSLAAPATAPPDSVPVWAFQMPVGQSHRVSSTSQPGFAFDTLPIGRYLLTADPRALSERGCWSDSVEVDLTANPQVQVALAIICQENNLLQGTIQDEANQGLPFSRIAVDRLGREAAALPGSGQFLLPGLDEQALTLIASAPGYYSQAQRYSPADGQTLIFSLARRPETTSLDWGTGEIILPAESQVNFDGLTLEVVSGWIWGAGDGDPLVIHTGSDRLQVSAGRFALSALPDQQTWFYLFSGQAEIQRPGEPAVSLSGGQMVLLSRAEPPTPVDYQPALVQALSQEAPAPALSQVWEPTPGAILRDRLARLGLNTAQALTFLVYTLALLALIIGPLFGLYALLRRRGTGRSASQ